MALRRQFWRLARGRRPGGNPGGRPTPRRPTETATPVNPSSPLSRLLLCMGAAYSTNDGDGKAIQWERYFGLYNCDGGEMWIGDKGILWRKRGPYMPQLCGSPAGFTLHKPGGEGAPSLTRCHQFLLHPQFHPPSLDLPDAKWILTASFLGESAERGFVGKYRDKDGKNWKAISGRFVRRLGLQDQLPNTRELREARNPYHYDYRDWMRHKIVAEERKIGRVICSADGTTWVRLSGLGEHWQYVVSSAGTQAANGVYVPRDLPGYEGPTPYYCERRGLWIIKFETSWFIAELGPDPLSYTLISPPVHCLPPITAAYLERLNMALGDAVSGPVGMWKRIGEGARELYIAESDESGPSQGMSPPVGEVWRCGEHGRDRPPVVLRAKLGTRDPNEGSSASVWAGAKGYKGKFGSGTKGGSTPEEPLNYSLKGKSGPKVTPGDPGHAGRTQVASKGGGLHYEPGSSTSSAQTTPRKPWKKGAMQGKKDPNDSSDDDDDEPGSDIAFQKELNRAMAESKKAAAMTPGNPDSSLLSISEEEQLRAALKTSALEAGGEAAAAEFAKLSEEEQIAEALRVSSIPRSKDQLEEEELEAALRASLEESSGAPIGLARGQVPRVPPPPYLSYAEELERALQESARDADEEGSGELGGLPEFGSRTPSTARSQASHGSELMPPPRGGVMREEPMEDAEMATALRASLALGMDDGVSDADLEEAMRVSLKDAGGAVEHGIDEPIWRTPRAAAMEEAGAAMGMVCPITNQPMADPVSLSDGQIYERTAIEDWLEFQDTSPVTGEQLASKMLTPFRL